MPGREPAARKRPVSAAARHPVTIHLTVLLGYVAAGIAVTWPHATYLSGRLPATKDAASYVWGFWWMAHSVEHLSNPWSTSYLAAPVGTQLGLHALMPLAGVLMLPVTAAFGPSASYTVLSIAMPGLLSYAMYRVARLWLSSQIAAIAAGAFFGFCAILDWQSWAHLNLAAGALFLPLALEAAVRLRRHPGRRQAVTLGLVLGASVLVDQQSSVLATALAAAALLPWVLGRLAPPAPPRRRRLARLLGWARPARLLSFARRVRLPGRPSRARLLGWARPARLLGWARPARLLSWARRARLPSRPRRARLLAVGLAAVVAAVVAGPQLIAVAQEVAAGGPPISPADYLLGIRLPDMFAPSPRVANFGLHIPHAHDASTYGAMLTALALAGLVLARRRLNAWLLMVLWLGCAAVALGSVVHFGTRTFIPLAQTWHGQQLSSVLPYTWFVRIPGLSGFREPSRIAELGIVAAALLAGFAVDWLRKHAAPLMVAVLALAVLEAGLSAPPAAGTMPTALPALDRPIAADHSGSIVVDVPYGLRGGAGIIGMPFNPETQVLATADGHPLADALLSRVPPATVLAIESLPFYQDLISAQTGQYRFSAAELQAAASNARLMHIGWVLLWLQNSHLRQYLIDTGFRFDYRVDGVSVFRPAPARRPAAGRS